MARGRLSNQSGLSLVELVAGSAIALIVLGAVVGLQIRAYRFQAADERFFVLQLEAANAVERMVQDIRTSSGAQVLGADCQMALMLSMDGETLTYVRTADGQVIRSTASGQVRTLGTETECLTFALTDGGIAIEWTAAPAHGRSFTLRTTAAPRVTPYTDPGME